MQPQISSSSFKKVNGKREGKSALAWGPKVLLQGSMVPGFSSSSLWTHQQREKEEPKRALSPPHSTATSHVALRHGGTACVVPYAMLRKGDKNQWGPFPCVGVKLDWEEEPSSFPIFCRLYEAITPGEICPPLQPMVPMQRQMSQMGQDLEVSWKPASNPSSVSHWASLLCVAPCPAVSGQ